MTGHAWLDVLVGIAAALMLSWLALVITLAVRRPKGGLLKESLRLLPDLLRLLQRLATDRNLPTGVRVRLGLLLAYLAIPIDLIPDFIPIFGYADDAIVVVLVAVLWALWHLPLLWTEGATRFQEPFWPIPEALCMPVGFRYSASRGPVVLT